jgi:hypothetical protein
MVGLDMSECEVDYERKDETLMKATIKKFFYRQIETTIV